MFGLHAYYGTVRLIAADCTTWNSHMFVQIGVVRPLDEVLLHFGVHHVLKRGLGELREQTGVVLAKTQQRRQIAISLGALDDKKNN